MKSYLEKIIKYVFLNVADCQLINIFDFFKMFKTKQNKKTFHFQVDWKTHPSVCLVALVSGRLWYKQDIININVTRLRSLFFAYSD